MQERGDRFTAIEDRYARYTVYDTEGDKIGKSARSTTSSSTRTTSPSTSG
jgi:hypothetical protein